MPIDVYAAMRAMLRAEATRRPVTPRTGTADPSPPAVDPAAPAQVAATVRDTSAEGAVPAPSTVPAPSDAPRPVGRARPSRYLSRCRAVLRAVRQAVSSCFAGRASRQGR
ncbi:hypothetical protein [Streptomyces rapamycinicus]|uniref:Uncharacterized protein n=2 Tax=Streptomyces rapamycinicus TaxID=1226757 RepID=A0A0A0NEB0_STRRN|nr:hypothetical protein [Streptomyces rapamycinicus]AGP52780.1 hypothetical protein M271_05770 [Streptomyces rapamycinicus NRRL 5491]MBB4780255.1 putative membrane protein [Streptomyces rapamycinicus]RLV75090.1 hypothetical protein D3C57_137730 [Streptomyces rapamycinicus NRRL 5491]UTO60991.1 hypothetical protein LJB45_00810 [Streptomyces rapamycinicus]UTP28935.1 hypothetical protein LIV37_05930 [Streptomyces rapamycinicus NRRL 5491]